MVAKEIADAASGALTKAPPWNLVIGGAIMAIMVIITIPSVADYLRREQQTKQQQLQIAENVEQREFVASENALDRAHRTEEAAETRAHQMQVEQTRLDREIAMFQERRKDSDAVVGRLFAQLDLMMARMVEMSAKLSANQVTVSNGLANLRNDHAGLIRFQEAIGRVIAEDLPRIRFIRTGEDGAPLHRTANDLEQESADD